MLTGSLAELPGNCPGRYHKVCSDMVPGGLISLVI